MQGGNSTDKSPSVDSDPDHGGGKLSYDEKDFRINVENNYTRLRNDLPDLDEIYRWLEWKDLHSEVKSLIFDVCLHAFRTGSVDINSVRAAIDKLLNTHFLYWLEHSLDRLAVHFANKDATNPKYKPLITMSRGKDYYERVRDDAKELLTESGLGEGEDLGWAQDAHPRGYINFPTVNACAVLSYMVGRAVLAGESLDIKDKAIPVIDWVRKNLTPSHMRDKPGFIAVTEAVHGLIGMGHKDLLANEISAVVPLDDNLENSELFDMLYADKERSIICLIRNDNHFVVVAKPGGTFEFTYCDTMPRDCTNGNPGTVFRCQDKDELKAVIISMHLDSVTKKVTKKRQTQSSANPPNLLYCHVFPNDMTHDEQSRFLDLRETYEMAIREARKAAPPRRSKRASKQEPLNGAPKKAKGKMCFWQSVRC